MNERRYLTQVWMARNLDFEFSRWEKQSKFASWVGYKKSCFNQQQFLPFVIKPLYQLSMFKIEIHETLNSGSCNQNFDFNFRFLLCKSENSSALVLYPLWWPRDVCTHINKPRLKFLNRPNGNIYLTQWDGWENGQIMGPEKVLESP